MISNFGEVKAHLDKLAKEIPLTARVVDLAQKLSAEFSVDADAAGFDLIARNILNDGVPNRARLKIFQLESGKLAVFFYKKSLLPYSRDRFAYGGRVFASDAVNDGDIKAWLDFVAGGFAPESRPAKMMRGFPYDVPQ